MAIKNDPRNRAQRRAARNPHPVRILPMPSFLFQALMIRIGLMPAP
jgi:hypothetical protein